MANSELGAVIDQETRIDVPASLAIHRAARATARPGVLRDQCSGKLWNRAEVVQALTAESSEGQGTVEVTQMETRVLGPGLVLLTHVSSRVGRRACRGALWRRSDDPWRLLFHQGTPFEVGAALAPPTDSSDTRRDK